MAEGIFISALLIIFLLMTVIYKNLKRPVLAAAFSAVGGTAGLICVNLLGMQIAVNLYTVSFSILMGIPGVITMLVIKMLI